MAVIYFFIISLLRVIYIINNDLNKVFIPKFYGNLVFLREAGGVAYIFQWKGQYI